MEQKIKDLEKSSFIAIKERDNVLQKLSKSEEMEKKYFLDSKILVQHVDDLSKKLEKSEELSAIKESKLKEEIDFLSSSLQDYMQLVNFLPLKLEEAIKKPTTHSKY